MFLHGKFVRCYELAYAHSFSKISWINTFSSAFLYEICFLLFDLVALERRNNTKRFLVCLPINFLEHGETNEKMPKMAQKWGLNVQNCAILALHPPILQDYYIVFLLTCSAARKQMVIMTLKR